MSFHEELHRMYYRDWVGARDLIRAQLRVDDSDSHWLMTKMAETYNFEGKHALALVWARRALEIAPRCPSVRWEQVFALCSLQRHAEAARVLRALIRRPVTSYFHAGDCSRSPSWVRTFITDCYYMLAWEEWLRGRHVDALKAQRQHLRRRLQGSRSKVGDSLRETRDGIRTAQAIIREKRKRPKR